MLVSLYLFLKPTSALSRIKTESDPLKPARVWLSFDGFCSDDGQRAFRVDGYPQSSKFPVRVNVFRSQPWGAALDIGQGELADDDFWDRVFGGIIRGFSPVGHLTWVPPFSDRDLAVDHKGSFEAEVSLDAASFSLIWENLGNRRPVMASNMPSIATLDFVSSAVLRQSSTKRAQTEGRCL